MADQGFEKPAYLHLKGDKNYLELAVREMKAMTKGGAMLSGHIQTVKCRSSKDVLTDLPIQDKKIQIPFEDFEFEQKPVVFDAQTIVRSSCDSIKTSMEFDCCSHAIFLLFLPHTGKSTLQIPQFNRFQ